MIQESINQIIGLTYGMMGIGKHLGGQEAQTAAVQKQTEAIKKYMTSEDVKKSIQDNASNFSPTAEEVRETTGATPPSVNGEVTPELQQALPGVGDAAGATYGSVIERTGREIQDKFVREKEARDFRQSILNGNDKRGGR